MKLGPGVISTYLYIQDDLWFISCKFIDKLLQEQRKQT